MSKKDNSPSEEETSDRFRVISVGGFAEAFKKLVNSIPKEPGHGFIPVQKFSAKSGKCAYLKYCKGKSLTGYSNQQ